MPNGCKFDSDSSHLAALCTNINKQPGVGKTAIAEGVAQILAAPSMMERLDELFDRDEDGTFTKKDEIDRLESLAGLCPARLRNHRVISLELANLVAGTKYRGEFEERLQAIVEEVTDEKAPPTILFIDGECRGGDNTAAICVFSSRDESILTVGNYKTNRDTHPRWRWLGRGRH